MIRADIETSVVLLTWVSALLISLVLGMKNDGDQKQQRGVPRPGRANSFIPSSFRAISGYLRVVSSGASSVARSAASIASSIVERDDESNHNQVIWAGFDTLKNEVGVTRRVLLLGYRSGFQVWDVEEADNVRDLVSRLGGPVSFMQMLSKPIVSKSSKDKFVESRPLLVVCIDGNSSIVNNIRDVPATPSNGTSSSSNRPTYGSFVPTVASFYSLRSQSFVYNIEFKSAIYAVKCSPRVIAISLVKQIHCINATTLEKYYTILTNPIIPGSPGFGGIGCGPLAVGPRWLAYSGSPVAVSDSRRVNPHLTSSASFSGFSSNGSLVAHYAKESSKQLAAGIMTLGDRGYKQLSRYCSELLPDSNRSLQSGSLVWKVNRTVNGHLTDAENVGMVIVRDIVSKAVIAQFRAHPSPISSLCFDPSGTLLVTASVQGHNFNVFKIMPELSENSSKSDFTASHVHLYRLQRGFTNAVIQDISFSYDSKWIMISSSRGTSHLFAINPTGGTVDLFAADSSLATNNGILGAMISSAVCWSPLSGSEKPNHQALYATDSPVTLLAVSRIRNGSSSWKEAASGAAAAATGRVNSFSGTIASTFHNIKGIALHLDYNSLKSNNYHLLVFYRGSMIQYKLRISIGPELNTGLDTAYESGQGYDARLLVEALQMWNICQKQNRRECEDNVDIYGENGSLDSYRVYPEGIKKGNTTSFESSRTIARAKVSVDEKHNSYIAQAELQVHPTQSPLWAKPELNFHSVTLEGVNEHHVDVSGGEIEIERIPTRMIEARSKDLIPVFAYLQIPRSSSGSLETMTDCGAALVKLDDGGETGQDNLHMPAEINGSVYINDSATAETQHETVNNIESLRIEAQLKSVNSSIEGVKTKNHFENEGDEFY